MATPTASAPVPAVLTALRAATHDAHKAVEQLTPFFRADFDRAAYLRWLDVMYGFYLRVDATVRASGFLVESRWTYLERCRLIERDVALLAARAPVAPADARALLAPLTALTQPAAVAGLLYVVEGSTLGGKVLLNVLARRAAVSADAGASFFAPHGESPHLRWADYVALLARMSVSPAWTQAAVHGAETTFTVLQAWLREVWPA
jgi:heme oxygenase